MLDAIRLIVWMQSVTKGLWTTFINSDIINRALFEKSLGLVNVNFADLTG